MNAKEKNFSNNLKSYFLDQKFFVDKIESRMTTTGIPDLLVLSPAGRESFIELKVVEDDLKINLTKGQIAWHSRRHLRHKITPFVILVEPKNAILVTNSLLVLKLVTEKGGKLNLDEIPEECWFKRSRIEYAMLTYTTTDLFYSSPRVYKQNLL